MDFVIVLGPNNVLYVEQLPIYICDLLTKINTALLVPSLRSRFGDLEVACWPLVPKFAGSHPAEAVGFLGRKNP